MPHIHLNNLVIKMGFYRSYSLFFLSIDICDITIRKIIHEAWSLGRIGARRKINQLLKIFFGLIPAVIEFQFGKIWVTFNFSESYMVGNGVRCKNSSSRTAFDSIVDFFRWANSMVTYNSNLYSYVNVIDNNNAIEFM